MRKLKPKAIIDISQSAFEGTGVGRFTLGLAKALNKYSKKIAWTFFFSSLRRKPPYEIRNFKKLFKLPLPPKFFEIFWNKFHILSPEILFKNYDFWISSDWVEPPVKKLQKITIIHDLVFLKYPKTVHPRILKNQRLRFKWLIKEAKLAITDSLTTKNDLKNLLKKQKIQKLLNVSTIDVERFLNIPIITIYPGVEVLKPQNNKILKKLNLTPRKYFITVGKLEPRKNLKRLINVFEKLDVKDFKLVIIGPKGWEEIKVKNKNIVLPGFVKDEDLYALYKNAFALVSASLWEGFGYPLIESALLKTPVICSNIQIYKEITRGHALFFNPKNVKEIKQTLEKALSQKEILQKNANNLYKIAKFYNWKNYVENFEKAILNL